MKTENYLNYVLAIKRLRLQNIGCWKDVTLNFSNGLNIITGGGGSGKSTILRAIINVMSNNHPSNYVTCYKNCRIEVDLLGRQLVSEFVVPDRTRKFALGEPCNGKELLINLSDFLSVIKTGYSVLIENEVMGRFDSKLIKKSIGLIQKADGQKIVVIRHLPGFRIKNARIFECVVNKDGSSKIVVRDV